MDFLVIDKSVSPAKGSRLSANSVEEAIIELNQNSISNFDLYLNIKDKDLSEMIKRLEQVEKEVIKIKLLLDEKMDSNKIQEPQPPLKNEKKYKDELIKIDLLEKSLSIANPHLGTFEDKLCFSIGLRNLTQKPVRAVKGSLVFYDLFDSEIFRVFVTINKRIESQSSTNWDGEMKYNQFISGHVHFASFKKEDLKIKLEDENVIFV